jgi:hypothetical protein
MDTESGKLLSKRQVPNGSHSGPARADDDIHMISGKRYPQPLTPCWRLYHFLLYINGGMVLTTVLIIDGINNGGTTFPQALPSCWAQYSFRRTTRTMKQLDGELAGLFGISVCLTVRILIL